MASEQKSVSKAIYEVLCAPKNGLQIAGKRRTKGERIELSDADAQFLLLDGLIGKVEATSKATKKAAAD